MTTLDIDRFRQALLEERERIQAAIEHLHQEHPGSLAEETGELASVDNHLADTATDTFDREMDYTLEDNAETLLAAVEAALRRIEEGTYGTCTRCGKPIAVERLEALPYAELCIDCKREVERG